MKFLSLVVLVCFGALVGAQIESNNPSKVLETQSKKGDLFTIKIVPKSKELQIHVVGTESARLNFEKTGLKVAVRVNGALREVGVEKRKGYFAVQDKVERPSELIMNVNSEGKTEKIEIPLN